MQQWGGRVAVVVDLTAHEWREKERETVKRERKQVTTPPKPGQLEQLAVDVERNTIFMPSRAAGPEIRVRAAPQAAVQGSQEWTEPGPARPRRHLACRSADAAESSCKWKAPVSGACPAYLGPHGRCAQRGKRTQRGASPQYPPLPCTGRATLHCRFENLWKLDSAFWCVCVCVCTVRQCIASMYCVHHAQKHGHFTRVRSEHSPQP